MKLFVTGGTGFIGAHFLNAAFAAGHEVVALRRSSPAQPRVPLTHAPQWCDGGFDAVRMEDLAGVEVTVHLAAAGVTPQPATWEDCFRVNVTDTLRFAQTALRAGVRRIVFAGSYAEYGTAGLRYPFIPPDAPLEPTDPYAASKACAGVGLSALCRAQRFELAYLRIFSVYGEGQCEKNFWPALRRAAQAGEDFPMTLGDQVRDFVPVADVAQALLAACTRTDLVAGTPWIRNLASGRPVTLLEFAQRCWGEFGARGHLRPGQIAKRPGEVARYVPEV